MKSSQISRLITSKISLFKNEINREKPYSCERSCDLRFQYVSMDGYSF